jgi:hypothetical protein
VHPHPDELETLTMARRYAAEGQLDRAIEIFEKLAALDPRDMEIAAQLANLREERGELPTIHPQQPAPPWPARPAEPMWMLDLEELPETYGINECEVLCKDPGWVFAYWEVTDEGLSSARAQLGPSANAARLVMRLFTTVARSTGVEREIQDVDLSWNHGRRYLQSPRSGAHLRVAVGLLSPEGYFAPIAHSSVVRVPAGEPIDGPVEWMEVLPTRSRGKDRDTLVIVRRGQDHAERTPQPSSELQAGGPGGASKGRWAPGSDPGRVQ